MTAARSSAFAALLLLGAGAAALAIPNPLRTFFPAVFGFVCDADAICVQDPAHADSARRLASAAREDIVKRLGPYPSPMKMFFCASPECYGTFGKRASTSETFGGGAVLIGPDAWQPHYVRHELIHVAQYQRLGLLDSWRTPEWLREGMAYSLSGDPRRPLPRENIEAWRAEFECWYRGEEGEALWERFRAALK